MRTVLVIAVVVACAYGIPTPETADEDDTPCCSRSSTRLNAQFVRLNRLTAEIQELSDAIDERNRDADTVSHELLEMNKRISELEGSQCEANEFQCGDANHRCVSVTEVCDNHSDCPDGSDETDLACETVVQAGQIWEGVPTYDTCTQRQPYKLKVVIKSVTEREFFHPRVGVDAQLIFFIRGRDYNAMSNLHGDGYYEFGRRRLSFDPPEEDNLALIADFDMKDNDHVHAYVIRAATGERCAMFVLSKQ